jgi:hypothetical protein
MELDRLASLALQCLVLLLRWTWRTDPLFNSDGSGAPFGDAPEPLGSAAMATEDRKIVVEQRQGSQAGVRHLLHKPAVLRLFGIETDPPKGRRLRGEGRSHASRPLRQLKHANTISIIHSLYWHTSNRS